LIGLTRAVLRSVLRIDITSMSTTTNPAATISVKLTGTTNPPLIIVHSPYGNDVAVAVSDPLSGAVVIRGTAHFDPTSKQFVPFVYTVKKVATLGYQVGLGLDLIPGGDTSLQLVEAQVTIAQVPDGGTLQKTFADVTYRFPISAPATPADDIVQPVVVAFA
jgi:hypothetical protein